MFKKNHPNYFYTSDGIRLFYNTNFSIDEFDPKKPVIVFIYGLLCSNNHFKYQIPYFEEQGYQILLHDYRFHFASSSDGDLETCTFPNITKDLHELLSELKIKKTLFIGHSMGVNICLEHARRYPEDVSAQVLISGTVVPLKTSCLIQTSSISLCHTLKPLLKNTQIFTRPSGNIHLKIQSPNMLFLMVVSIKNRSPWSLFSSI